MTPQTFSSQYISVAVASPSLSLLLYELQLFESLSTRLPLPSLFFSASGFVCSGMDGGVGLCWQTGTHRPFTSCHRWPIDEGWLWRLQQICKIVCTIQVQMETVWVRYKLDCTFFLLSSPLHSPCISHGPALGRPITIDIINNKLLQVTENFLCDWKLCTTCCYE